MNDELRKQTCCLLCQKEKCKDYQHYRFRCIFILIVYCKKICFQCVHNCNKVAGVDANIAPIKFIRTGKYFIAPSARACTILS